MTKTEFIELVSTAITQQCGIPLNLTADVYDNVIQLAANYFYRHWEGSAEKRYLAIAAALFEGVEFKNERTITLPDCIISVASVSEYTANLFSGSPDKDFTSNKFLLADAYLAPFDTDGLLYRTVNFAFFDFAKIFLVNNIRYDYNPNTHKLSILGHNPYKDVVCVVFTKISHEDLFNEEKFQRWVIAELKVRSGRTMNFFQAPLIGGVSISASDLMSEGKEELSELKQEILDEQAGNTIRFFN